MKRWGVWMCALIAAVTAASVASGDEKGKGKAPRSANARVARGKYLVVAGSCGDCHTPKSYVNGEPVEDATRTLSGHREGDKVLPAPQLTPPWMAATNPDFTAWAGPWGVSYAINLTPDENTGIGSWSEETFINALKSGKHMGVSRPILPPMPWPAIRNYTDEDLKSIYAYLRSIPVVHNRVPDPEAPPPAK